MEVKPTDVTVDVDKCGGSELSFPPIEPSGNEHWENSVYSSGSRLKCRDIQTRLGSDRRLVVML